MTDQYHWLNFKCIPSLPPGISALFLKTDAFSIADQLNKQNISKDFIHHNNLFVTHLL